MEFETTDRPAAFTRWAIAAGAAVMLTACSPLPANTGPASTGTPPPANTVAATTASVLPGEPWVAFQWLLGDGSDTVFLIRPDGTGQHPLVTDVPGDEWHPDWSPEGDRLAFIQHTPDDRTELWVVDAAGTNAKLLYRCELPCNEVSYPDWSPDGKAIFYGMSADPKTDGPPGTFKVVRYDLATGASKTILTRKDGSSAEQPRVSPDGSMVAYTRVRESPGKPITAALFVADVAGGPERRLTGWDMVAMHPDWTADSRIVFDTFDIMVFPEATGPANLWVVGADGSHLKALTHFKAGALRASQPRVAPDGSGITFTRLQGSGGGTRQLAMIGLDGSDKGWLTTQPVPGTHAELRPLA